MTLQALRVRGPFRGPSGYDHHTREFVRELVKQGIAVELIDLPEWSAARLDDAQRDPWFESLTESTGASVALHFAMPHQVRPVPGCATVNFTMFEATRISPAWVASSVTHDLVVLPTESSRQAWIRSGVPESLLRLCPLGIDPVLYGPPAEPLELQRDNGQPISDFKTRFLNISELGPRKNLVGLLRTWIQTTSRADDAILVLKLGSYARGMLELFRFELRSMQEQLGKSLAEAAPVKFLMTTLVDAEMPRLYAAASHYISLSFGEGWDQAMFEAAASGLSLIAPDHSAYRAYLDETVARLLPSREVPACFPPRGGIEVLFGGASWWEPDQAAAIAAIREAIDGGEPQAASARTRILSELTWERATRRLIEILSEVERR